MTHRQFLAWKAWLEREWDRPSRSDFYQMQTAFHACRPHMKSPRRLKMDHMRLRFGKAGSGPRQTPEQSKAKWLLGFASMGVKVREVN